MVLENAVDTITVTGSRRRRSDRPPVPSDADLGAVRRRSGQLSVHDMQAHQSVRGESKASGTCR